MTNWSPLAPCVLVLLALVAFAGSAPRAGEPEADGAVGAERRPWTVQSVSGWVGYHASAADQAQQVSSGDEVAATARLESGPDGTATLVRNKDTIRVYPNTHFEVAPARDGTWGTLIRQTLGKLFFDVETVPGRSFRVETPALMAGVTGTQFTVEVTQHESTLAVREGTVWVARADRQGEPVSFRAGETARVRVAVPGDGVSGARSQPSSSVIGSDIRLEARQLLGSTAHPMSVTLQTPLGHTRLTIDPRILLLLVAAIAVVVVVLPRMVAAIAIVAGISAWALPAQWVLMGLVLVPAGLLWRRWFVDRRRVRR